MRMADYMKKIKESSEQKIVPITNITITTLSSGTGQIYPTGDRYPGYSTPDANFPQEVVPVYQNGDNTGTYPANTTNYPYNVTTSNSPWGLFPSVVITLVPTVPAEEKSDPRWKIERKQKVMG